MKIKEAHPLIELNPKLKHFPTKKLKEILDDPYLRGSDYGKGEYRGGKDYEGEYGREEIEQEYLARLARKDEAALKEFEDEMNEYQEFLDTQKKPRRKKITLSWDIYEALKEKYAYLELKHHPFINVRLYYGKTFLVTVGDGYNVYHEKGFKNLDEAFIYAEDQFKKEVANKTNFTVVIK